MSEWDYRSLWERALSEIKKSNTDEMWISYIHYENSQEGLINLAVPSAFYKNQIEKKYKSILESKIHEISGENLKINININENLDYSDENTEVKPEENPVEFADARKNITETYNTNLNKNYTFERFVQSEANSFAYNASYAISKNPGKEYNPLLIYGGVGLGKTHLMEAIGNEISRERNDLKILYITAEQFTNEFLYSLSDHKTREFKNKYRNVDVLLIDDIHFFSGKKQVQEELFYTFEALYSTNHQIVFTCDRTLDQVKDLNDRLRSRFGRGLQVDLQPPVFETRCSILMKKAEEKKVSFSQEVIEFVARNIATNVRDLEAALTKIIAYKELVNKEITVEIAQNLLKDSIGNRKTNDLSVELIIKIVADYFNISHVDIKGKKRNTNISFARQISMYLIREMTNYSTTEIGIEFGGKDHSTVMYSCRQIEEKLKCDPTMDSTIQTLKTRIKNQSSAR